MDILVMFFSAYYNPNKHTRRSRSLFINQSPAITGSVEHTETCDICDETTTCVKNQSLLTATRKTERERARAWAPVLCSCQRHGGSSTTRRQARQRDQQPRNHGSRGKSPKGGGQRLGRARCEVHLCDVMHAHFYHDS